MWQVLVRPKPTKHPGPECLGDHTLMGHGPTKMPSTRLFVQLPHGAYMASGEVGQQDNTE
jgi:hypothetical protein